MGQYAYRNIITGEVFVNDRPILTLNEQWTPWIDIWGEPYPQDSTTTDKD